jgi:predicted nicotinamide N-methyase
MSFDTALVRAQQSVLTHALLRTKTKRAPFAAFVWSGSASIARVIAETRGTLGEVENAA